MNLTSAGAGGGRSAPQAVSHGCRPFPGHSGRRGLAELPWLVALCLCATRHRDICLRAPISLVSSVARVAKPSLWQTRTVALPNSVTPSGKPGSQTTGVGPAECGAPLARGQSGISCDFHFGRNSTVTLTLGEQDKDFWSSPPPFELCPIGVVILPLGQHVPIPSAVPAVSFTLFIFPFSRVCSRVTACILSPSAWTPPRSSSGTFDLDLFKDDRPVMR